MFANSYRLCYHSGTEILGAPILSLSLSVYEKSLRTVRERLVDVRKNASDGELGIDVRDTASSKVSSGSLYWIRKTTLCRLL